jgi:hypothetical protein
LKTIREKTYYVPHPINLDMENIVLFFLRKRMVINHPGYYFTVDDNGENSGISKKVKNTKLFLFLILNS